MQGGKSLFSSQVSDINQRIEAAKGEYCSVSQTFAGLVTRGIPNYQSTCRQLVFGA